jgi:hypothetical protein
MQVWVLYYSQTGDSAAVANAIAEPFRVAGHDVCLEPIRLAADYPYPWRSLLRFFSVLPECLLGPPPKVEPVEAELAGPVDLMILVYQVWFLSPSLPVQGFLASPVADRLRNQPVITVSVSRNMWLSASEAMKRRLAELGAVQLDNIAVTHQGPPWATFITTPRALLLGRRDAFWFFPPAGIAEAALERVRRLGRQACERWSNRPPDDRTPLLRGAGAVEINGRYLIPECLGWYLFTGWAYVLKVLGRLGRMPRALGTVAFIGWLVIAIPVGIPLVGLGTLVAWPFIRHRVAAYRTQLAAPSGEATPTE